jgi:pimeloyl-ACP methyl ester carboxylesterase
MLHGYTDSWFSFSPILPLLPPYVRAIVPDQRGHGDSDKEAAGYTLDALAVDAIELLDALGVPRATVAGHSMGSLVAQRVAALAPARVSDLLLIGTAATARNQVMNDLLDAVSSLEDPIDAGFVRDFQTSTIHRPVSAHFYERVVEESLKVPARIWKAALHALIAAEAVRVPASCPVRIVWGDRDAIFSRAEQDVLRQRLPGASFTAIHDVGHAVHWEVPDVIARELAGIPVVRG